MGPSEATEGRAGTATATGTAPEALVGALDLAWALEVLFLVLVSFFFLVEVTDGDLAVFFWTRPAFLGEDDDCSWLHNEKGNNNSRASVTDQKRRKAVQPMPL